MSISSRRSLRPALPQTLRILRRPTLSCRSTRTLLCGLVISVLGAAAHAQVAVVTPLDKQLNRMDLAVSGVGLFNSQTTGTTPSSGPEPNTQVTDTPGNTFGALVTLRYVAKPLVGFEGNISYARFTQNYTNIGGVQANADEYSLGYVAHLPELFGVKPFAAVGAGSIAYKPTSGGGQELKEQARALYYYSIGLEDMISEHFGVRAQFRQTISLAPDFGQNYLTIKQRTISSQPGIGIYLHF
jgi:hypothetical protein